MSGTVRFLLVNEIPMPRWFMDMEAANSGLPVVGDEAKMRLVIGFAVENVLHETGGPFAAAIFDMKTDLLIGAGINVVVPARQSWAHAEMTAFAHAQNRLGAGDLRGCMLVTSCEPCAMCSGAVPWSGVEKVVYGASKAMAEELGFDEGYKGERWREEFAKRGIETVGPLLGESAFEPFAVYRKKNGKIY